MIFELDFFAPWFGMDSQPGIAFILPFIAETNRHCIGKSKRDEVNCAFLLPMR